MVKVISRPFDSPEAKALAGQWRVHLNLPHGFKPTPPDQPERNGHSQEPPPEPGLRVNEDTP